MIYILRPPIRPSQFSGPIFSVLVNCNQFIFTAIIWIIRLLSGLDHFDPGLEHFFQCYLQNTCQNFIVNFRDSRSINHCDSFIMDFFPIKVGRGTFFVVVFWNRFEFG